MKPGSESIPRPRHLRAAFVFLTTLPVGPEPDGESSAASSWAWPVVGACVGILGGSVAYLSILAGTGTAVAALLSIAVMIVATGALHEDGLADSADGLFSGGTRDKRMEIMRDSRTGAYGAIAIAVFLIGRHASLDNLLQASQVFGPLIAACSASRAAMQFVLRFLPMARPDGLAAGFGVPPNLSVASGLVLASILAFTVVGWQFAPAIAIALATAFVVAWIATRRIGGVTGDVLGAAQQSAELSCMIFLVTAS